MSYQTILKGRYALFAPLLVLLLAAMACGDEATAEPTRAPATTAPATTAPTAMAPDSTTAPDAAMTPQPTPVPTAVATTAPTTAPDVMTPKLGNRLRVAVNSFGNEDMNPNNAGKIYGLAVGAHAADFMMGIEEDNTLTNAWGWSESWEQIAGDTWDFHIREGMVDHDGVEVTAEDCVWITHHWATDLANQPGGAISPGWQRQIFKDSEALDTHHCRVYTKQDYAFMWNIIPPIGGADLYAWPKRGWVDLAGGDVDKFDQVGAPMTGFVDYIEREVGNYVRHERFEDYYADEDLHFKFREMEIIVSAEDAPRLAQVSAGEVDIANSSGPYVEEIRNQGLRVDGPQNVDVVYLSLYETQDPNHCTSKLEVRKAMNLAVDQEAVVNGIWAPGTATRAISPFSTFYDESHNPLLQPYPYDPDEARRLLEAAGCAGFEFEGFGYSWAAGPEMADMVDAVVTYLQGVGINARYTPLDWTANVDKVNAGLMSSEYTIASGGAHWQLAARNFGEKIRVHGLCRSHGGGVCNLDDQDYWEDVYLSYAAMTDKVARIKFAQEKAQELYDGYYGVPIALRSGIWAINPNTICGEWHPVDGTPSHVMFNTLIPCETS